MWVKKKGGLSGHLPPARLCETGPGPRAPELSRERVTRAHSRANPLTCCISLLTAAPLRKSPISCLQVGHGLGICQGRLRDDVQCGVVGGWLAVGGFTAGRWQLGGDCINTARVALLLSLNASPYTTLTPPSCRPYHTTHSKHPPDTTRLPTHAPCACAAACSPTPPPRCPRCRQSARQGRPCRSCGRRAWTAGLGGPAVVRACVRACVCVDGLVWCFGSEGVLRGKPLG